jgi:F-type H+-transporting ATPase subunit a
MSTGWFRAWLAGHPAANEDEEHVKEVSPPLEQFVVKPIVPLHLGPYDISYTNSALLMTIIVALIVLFLVGATRRNALVPGRLQSVAELTYEFVANMVRDNVGTEGMAFFPLVFAIFMFVLFGNFLGLVPYSFTVTGQAVVTFGLSIFVFIFVTLVGLVRHRMHFFSFFLPPGAPALMAPVMVPIEIVSYLSRPLSLGIRLFANMVAGHTMMAVFAGFVITLGVFGLLPIAINVAMYALEMIVCALQAYVFAILTCVYLNDAIHLH